MQSLMITPNSSFFSPLCFLLFHLGTPPELQFSTLIYLKDEKNLKKRMKEKRKEINNEKEKRK